MGDDRVRFAKGSLSRSRGLAGSAPAPTSSPDSAPVTREVRETCPISHPSSVPHSWLVDLGLVPYDDALALQAAAVAARAEGRLPDLLLLLEHPPVITLGRAAKAAHVLASPAARAACGIELRETGRGGDVTLHAPGQLVGYPIVDLTPRGRDVHRYLRDLEEVLIRAAAGWGIEAGRIPKLTGVWVGDDKLAAIGVAVKRWIAHHGFALNVSNDLALFDLIVPCGLSGKGVTSVSRLHGGPATIEEAASHVTAEWPAVFATHLIEVSRQRLEAVIGSASSEATTESRNTRTTVGSHCDPAPSSRMSAA
jgi:lipoyl(octanoyl) transferase